MKFRFGDSLLNLCCALYVSRIACERGHVIAVAIVWILSIVGNAFGDWARKKSEDAAIKQLDAMKAKLERRRAGEPE